MHEVFATGQTTINHTTTYSIYSCVIQNVYYNDTFRWINRIQIHTTLYNWHNLKEYSLNYIEKRNVSFEY